MQRILLSAALLAACGAAQAQATSSVTLYGVADIGVFYERVKVKGQGSTSTTGLQSGTQAGSRWGLRGKEDLGNGLAANFQLESGFDLANGQQTQGRLFGRAAWLGMSGGFGEFRLGRQGSISSSWFGPVSPFGTGYGIAAIGKAGFRASDTPRYDNEVQYYSPKFSGFQIGLGYTFNSSGGMAERNDSTQAYNIAARYDNGPLLVVATYDRLDPAKIDPNANGRDPSAIQVGARYKLGFGSIHAGWSQAKDGWVKSADGRSADLGGSAYFDGKVNSFLVGLSAPLGGGELLAAYYYNKPGSGVLGGDKVNVFALAYDYKLSKRTSIYGLAAYHDGNLYTFNKGTKTSQFGVGIRHNF